MSPARYPDSGSLNRRDSVIRNVIFVGAATVIGTIVGGVSVLAVVLAVVPPSDEHQLRYETRTEGSGKDAAAAPQQIQATQQMQKTPAAASSAAAPSAAPNPAPDPAPSPPATPAMTAPAQPQPVAPIDAQNLPPPALQPAEPAAPTGAQSQAPAQVLHKTWPDALTERTRHERETKAAEPVQAPAATPVPVEQTTVPPADDSRKTASERPRPSRRTVTSRTVPSIQDADEGAPPPVVYPRQRAIVIQRNAPPVQTETAEDAPVAREPRPLFDFFGLFGNRRYNDNRYDGDDYNSGYRDNWNNDRRW